MNWCHRESTHDEILSDSIVRGVMEEPTASSHKNSRQCRGRRARSKTIILWPMI
jgi:hypothetical protein